MCWVDVEKTHGAIRSCYIFKVAKKRVMSREHWVGVARLGGWLDRNSDIRIINR